MKSFYKILASSVGLGFICFILILINSFFGNPLSKHLAQNGAEKYLATQYPALTYLDEDVFYNFKIGGYTMQVTDPASIDTHFSIALSMQGNLLYDDYDLVTSGWNTAGRIEEDYHRMVEAVLSAPDFPLVSAIDFGTIEFFKDGETPPADGADYAIPLKSLVLDQEYDAKEFGKRAGHIIYYAQDEEISFQRAAELLLLLKERLDQEEIPFYAVDFVLEKPRNPDGTSSTDPATVHTSNFLYREIHPDGLAKRIEQAHNELTAYYAEQDAERNAEKTA